MSSVGAVRKVSSNWSQETMARHSSNCFSTVCGQGNAALVTYLPSKVFPEPKLHDKLLFCFDLHYRNLLS